MALKGYQVNKPRLSRRLPGDVKAKAASLYEAKLNSLKNARNAGGDHVQPHKVFMS